MIFVALLTAACVVVGAIIPPVIARALADLDISASFPVVVWLTASIVAGIAFLLRLFVPDTASALDQREDAVSTREGAVSARELDVKAREERAAQVDERITLRMHDITDQAAELDRARRDLDARTSALYKAEAEHKAEAAALAERMALFDMAQTQATILEARSRLDDERAALRDERAALTGERIALDAVRTLHATAVRKHAAEVKALNAARKAEPARASRKREATA